MHAPEGIQQATLYPPSYGVAFYVPFRNINLCMCVMYLVRLVHTMSGILILDEILSKQSLTVVRLERMFLFEYVYDTL